MKITPGTSLEDLRLKHLNAILEDIFYIPLWHPQSVEPKTVQGIIDQCTLHPDRVLQMLRHFCKLDSKLGLCAQKLEPSDVIIDGRTEDDYNPVIRTKHTKLYQLSEPKAFFNEHREDRLVFAAHTERRSYGLALYFYDLGYENSRYLEGGLDKVKL